MLIGVSQKGLHRRMCETKGTQKNTERPLVVEAHLPVFFILARFL